ncbi:hypothetical protein SAMN05216378_5388 [Paenibacillus catalpae]|uniref:Uncharacterized protein n=1 Tax=Paenibacillus catalpae TaxID=1045775 RepID=A0A1I2GQ75_9BACL|nr:hypothetical protein SAMN05216378_5388 [Paenibacillus catalpae]
MSEEMVHLLYIILLGGLLGLGLVWLGWYVYHRRKRKIR